MALFDYDGDGRLDVYLVTAAELDRRARADPAPQRALPEPRRVEVRGRLDEGRRGRRRLGQRRLRRRLRRRRAPRPLRDELGLEPPLPQPRRRHVRGGGGEGRRGGGRLEHRLRVLRRRRGRRPRPVRRALRRRRPGTTSSSAQRTLVWRNGPRIMVGPAGLPGEADLFFENLGGGRFLEAAAARGLADPARAYGFGVVDDRLRRRRAGGPVRGQRLEPELPLPQPRGRPVRERRAARRRRHERRGARPGGHGRGRGGLRRRRPRGPRPHRVRPRQQHALPQPGRPPVRRR